MARDRQIFLVLADNENHDKTLHNPGLHHPHMLQMYSALADVVNVQSLHKTTFGIHRN